MSGDPPNPFFTNTGNYWFGDDHCHCRRCPCCGKLVAAPYYPWYPNPYITYTTSYFYGYNTTVVPNVGNTTSFTVTVDGKKK